jgi:uncharacterized protein
MARVPVFALSLLFAAMPASAADFSASDVSLDTGDAALFGTLVTPASGGPVAAALILAGSGPTDRDGNSTVPGVQPDNLRQIAEALAARGIATLRTDKRGIGASKFTQGTEADLTIGTYAKNAGAWVAELKRHTGLTCVWLIGHSEGALIAELAANGNPDICGLILIAGTGRPLGAIVRAQIDSNPANPPGIRKAVYDILASLETGKPVADVPPVLMGLFRPSVQPYLMSELTLDPAALLARLKIATLILQGDNDIQIEVADARLLATARPDVELVVLPGVNHVLKVAPTDRAGNFATYADPTLPLAPGVVPAIADFITAKR